MSTDLSSGPVSPAAPRTLFLAPVTDPADPALPESGPAAEVGQLEPGYVDRARSAARAIRWSAVALAVVLVAVEAVIAAESFGGLVDFARLIRITGRAAYGVPVTLDGVGLAAAIMALRAELAGESSAMPRVALFAFTAASAASNWWAHQDQAAAAVYFGGMSLAVAFMFALVLRQLRAEDRRRARLVSNRLPKIPGQMWLRYPLTAWRALSLAILRGYRTPREAIDAALAAATAAKVTAVDLDPATLASLTPRDRLVVAFGAVGAVDVPKALALLERHGCAPDQSHAYQIRKSLTSGKDGEKS